MSQETLPAIVVTNYQQYINADFLQQAIADTIPQHMDVMLPEYIYVSIAYIAINKVARKNKGGLRAQDNAYNTVLVLSIKGVTYKYTLMHSDTDLYLAKAALDTNQYASNVTKDMHIRLLQQAFETLVFMRVDRIVDDLIDNNINLQ